MSEKMSNSEELKVVQEKRISDIEKMLQNIDLPAGFSLKLGNQEVEILYDEQHVTSIPLHAISDDLLVQSIKLNIKEFIEERKHSN